MLFGAKTKQNTYCFLINKDDIRNVRFTKFAQYYKLSFGEKKIV